MQHITAESYQAQLDDKKKVIETLFGGFDLPTLEIFNSPAKHYRLRAEFKIWHEDETCHFAMYKPGEYKKPYKIERFEAGSELINTLMPKLLEQINQQPILKKKLFQVEFLTTLSGEALISLIYHKQLDEQWLALAHQLKASLGANIIGRSKKQKLVVDKDFVNEQLSVNGTIYHYQQIESTFTQPNGCVCEKMLTWAVDISKHLAGDLIELYCGNGNFTLPLAKNFKQVLATEISKVSVKSAILNLHTNQINNVSVVRMSSEELTQAQQKQREFRRLKEIDLDSFQFSTLFVDPPRAGLDEQTVHLAKSFENIIYISCNPQTLRDNLETLCKTHAIERFALFDQFPYTPHIECGVLLRSH